jgi:tetratricopeptide (TPR) repeat protein
MKSITKIALIALFIAPALFAQDAASFYNDGNRAYIEGDFQAAVEHYLYAIDAGAADYRLFFNLGNAYFRLDEIGRAILSWERARLLSPRNRDVFENLYFARSTRVDIVREAEGGPKVGDVYENTFLGFVYNFLGKFSADEFITVLIILSIIATLLLAIWILARGGFRRFAFWTSAAIWMLFLIVTSLFAIKQGNVWETGKAIVLRPGAEIRSASSESSQLLYSYQEGMEVAVIETRENYSRVKLRNGEEGWMLSDYIERVIPK